MVQRGCSAGEESEGTGGGDEQEETTVHQG